MASVSSSLLTSLDVLLSSLRGVDNGGDLTCCRNTENDNSSPTTTAVSVSNAPIGLEHLYTTMLQSQHCILQGPSGSGKTFLLQHVCKEMTGSRIVWLNAAHNSTNWVYEVVQQLSGGEDNNRNDATRLKRTSHSNHLALLNEMLFTSSREQQQCTVIVLDDFCTTMMMGDDINSILYTLLDPAWPGLKVMVATSGPLKLEKRVESRVSGMCTLLHMPAASYPTAWKPIWNRACQHAGLLDFLDLSSVTLQRQAQLGQSTRWFVQTMIMAVCLYKQDVERDPNTKWNATLYIQQVVDVDSSFEHQWQWLSPPHIMVLLAARRILVRESQRTTTTTTTPQPLTLHRLQQELAAGPQLYPPITTLTQAWLDLIEYGLIAVARQHSGMDLYEYSCGNNSSNKNHVVSLHEPLHVTLDVFRELSSSSTTTTSWLAHCPTAVQEWGRKNH